MNRDGTFDWLLELISEDSENWDALYKFVASDDKNLSPFFKITQKVTRENFKNILKIYTPGTRFPAISITGEDCQLHCEHCNEKYLKGMHSIRTPDNLESYLLMHHKNGGVGVLISGGCLSDGSVPILNFLDSIKKIKEATDLIINTHPGLLNEETARKLADANVDIISFDITLDPEIIRNIYHLDKTKEDYKEAIKLLNKYEVNIIPHICIGLHYGALNKELDALKYIKTSGMVPSLIVFIALIPPSNKRNIFQTPLPNDIAKIIGITRLLFPNTELSLGCMRPRRIAREEIEIKSYKAGINRIVLPSKKSLKKIQELNPKIDFEYYSACCAIPQKYEGRIKRKHGNWK
ncbi:MAG: Biotin synthase [Promethearchaeota archaeon]|nr:MAG: Biotin synthase [Candidatus Lokiarchaeota archaeon]